MGDGSLVRADSGHRPWQLVGLLRTWLGWMVVLGSGRKCLADAMAGSNRLVAFHHCCRTARRPEKLDRTAGHTGVLAIACRHLHCALRPADIGSQLCQRPGPRCFHSRHFAGRSRHTTITVCHSRSADHKPQRFRIDQPRRRPDPE